MKVYAILHIEWQTGCDASLPNHLLVATASTNPRPTIQSLVQAKYGDCPLDFKMTEMNVNGMTEGQVESVTYIP